MPKASRFNRRELLSRVLGNVKASFKGGLLQTLVYETIKHSARRRRQRQSVEFSQETGLHTSNLKKV
jgi:hypothetical protein